MRPLRAVWANAGPVLLLVATTALSLVTIVVSAAAAEEARQPVLLAPAALALLVTAGPSVELARRRRAEVTLVKLRGTRGLRLLAHVAGQPVTVVLVAGGVGSTAGAAAVRMLHTTWDLPRLIGVGVLVPAALLVGAQAVVAAGAAVVVAREPLPVAVRRRSWSGPGPGARFVGMVAGVATVLGAVLAAYSGSGDDPGSLVLAGPVLFGLAAGQLVVWMTRSASNAAGRVAGVRSTGLLLGVRRALGTEHAAGVRAVIAAGVVTATSLGALLATAGWADESARLGQGAPLRLDLSDGTAQETLLLTRRLDPEGRWLMAAAVNDGRDEARYRTAWLDLERYDEVASDFLSSTPADVDPAVESLRAAPPVRFVTGDGLELAAAGAETASVTVSYVGDGGSVGSVAVPLGSGRAQVEDCAEGCVVLSLAATEAVEVTGLSLGGTDLLDLAWVDASGAMVGPGAVRLGAGAVVRPGDGAGPEPMLVAGRLDFGEDAPQVDDVGGAPRALEQVGARPALPLVRGAGLLGDLPVALAGAPGTIPAVRSLVLARSDTPEDLLAALREAGAGPPVSLDPARSDLGAQQRAEDRVRRVGLVSATALGLLALLTGRHRRRQEHAHDDAVMRLLGVRAAELRRARVVEATVLATLVLGAILLGGWVAAVTVVDSAGLVPTGPALLPLDASPRLDVLLGTAVAGALATSASVVRGARRGSAALLVIGEEPEP
ncbi:hypothetical protein [Nocardioides dilutus]